MRPEDVARAVALNDDGRSVRFIAEFLGEAKSTVQDAITRYRQTGRYTRREGSGRPRITNGRDNRFISLTALRDRSITSTVISRRLQNVRGVAASTETIRRRLLEGGLRSRRPAACHLLLPAHRRGRLNFAREYRNWGAEEWANVLFTDESRFCLRSPDGRERVWRRPGERFEQCCISERIPFGGGSVMVWAGVSLHDRTELVLIENGSLTADRYIRQCLSDHVIPFSHLIGPNFRLMQDNARPHVARIVTQYLDEVNILPLQWPSRSPDLNPIEHVWDMLGRRVRQRNIETLPDLRTALLEEWENIPQEGVTNSVASMPRRLMEVIGARGGNTRY